MRATTALKRLVPKAAFYVWPMAAGIFFILWLTGPNKHVFMAEAAARCEKAMTAELMSLREQLRSEQMTSRRRAQAIEMALDEIAQLKNQLTALRTAQARRDGAVLAADVGKGSSKTLPR
ncbi:MAG: hypothetical protein DIU63_03475 [Proteobacteria bacterium]|jgi:hypothetical protein|nr:MAG: hypothetical protein DIU63_03475 [Pseudomonadota bacterium]